MSVDIKLSDGSLLTLQWADESCVLLMTLENRDGITTSVVTQAEADQLRKALAVFKMDLDE